MSRCPSLLLGFDDQLAAVQRLAEALSCPMALVQRHRFPDGELKLTLPFAQGEGCPGTLVLYRSLAQPNEKLVELMLVAAQARSWGVRRILLVAPYLAYMRQDMSFHTGEVVSQRLVGQSLAHWFDGVITVDPHLHRVATLQEAVPADWTCTVSAAPALAEHIARHVPQPVLVGPDVESAQWVQQAAEVIGAVSGVCHKERLGDRDVQIVLPDLAVQDRAVVLLDDMASSGRTLAVAARQLLDSGALSVDVAVTHALFADDAVATVRAAGVRHIWSADSVTHDSNAVYLAPLLASGITPFLNAC